MKLKLIWVDFSRHEWMKNGRILLHDVEKHKENRTHETVVEHSSNGHRFRHISAKAVDLLWLLFFPLLSRPKLTYQGRAIDCTDEEEHSGIFASLRKSPALPESSKGLAYTAVM